MEITQLTPQTSISTARQATPLQLPWNEVIEPETPDRDPVDLSTSAYADADLEPERRVDVPQDVQVTLDFDEKTKRVVARLVDLESGKLVQQIPSEDLLRDAAGLREWLAEQVMV